MKDGTACPARRQMVKELNRFRRRVDGLSDDEQIHQLRVLIKKLRAYLTLYPGTCDSAPPLRAELQQLAGSYAGLRDGCVMENTMLSLVARCSRRQRQQIIQPITMALFRDGLLSAGEPLGVDFGRLDTMLARWPAGELSPTDCDSKVATCYRRAGKAGRLALSAEDDGLFHRWRKRCKQLLYLLPLASTRTPRQTRARLKRLTDVLGEFQDLCVLEAYLTERGIPHLESDSRESLAGLIACEKSKRKKRARHLQRKLFEAS